VKPKKGNPKVPTSVKSDQSDSASSPDIELVVRRATAADKDSILEDLLQAEDNNCLESFGTLDIAYLIEVSVLSVVVLAESGKVYSVRNFLF
jgi:hypothetical protein